MRPPGTFSLLIIASSMLFPAVLLSGDGPRPVHADSREVIETEVDAAIDEVWSAFTTTAGLKRWCAPLVEIDFKVGGKMRANYDSEGVLGDVNTIENTILSFDPRRMLSLKATKAPAGFPFPNAIKEVWTVLYFEETAPGKTRITLVGLGYTDTEESRKMRGFFEVANQYEFNKLKESFRQPAKD